MAEGFKLVAFRLATWNENQLATSQTSGRWFASPGGVLEFHAIDFSGKCTTQAEMKAMGCSTVVQVVAKRIQLACPFGHFLLMPMVRWIKSNRRTRY